MRLEPHQFWSLSQWLFREGSLLYGAALVVTMAAFGFFVCYVVAMVRQGPGEGFFSIAKVIYDLFRTDLPKTSLSRVWAIAKLAFLEAIRRKVLAVIGIFIVGILFAGWFLDKSADDPAKLYISFVLTATNYLILLLGLFLSAFSIPADIKNRTIYTIVTKPVRPTEIVLGRVVGFSLIGSVVLAVLGLLSYVFVVRGLNHSHEVATIGSDGRNGVTDVAGAHSHNFRLNEDGKGVTDESKGHQHTVTATKVNGETVYKVGPPIGNLSARVPVYGSLTYTDRNGIVSAGLNVGYMSEYRKFIAGGSLSSAIWNFENVKESDFPDGLEIEMNIEAFRTYKGDIVTPVRGTLILRSPDETVESERVSFLVKESLDRKVIPLKLSGFRLNKPEKLELFKDLVVDGRVQIIIRCEDSQQYLGMAAADLALRAGEKSFAWNFFKGYVSIWLQMVIVICFGVMYSTFLSGPVAMVATLSSLVLGFFGANIDTFFNSQYNGGGPVEAIVRILTQKGTMIDLDLGNQALERTIRTIDYGLMSGVSTLKSAVPDFGRLGTSDFIAYGVDLFDGLLARHLLIALGYFIMTTIIGYFFLKTREMAA
jgi:ABC-type transport system involved in multi-copper enzyme maturation permease subunit